MWKRAEEGEEERGEGVTLVYEGRVRGEGGGLSGRRTIVNIEP